MLHSKTNDIATQYINVVLSVDKYLGTGTVVDAYYGPSPQGSLIEPSQLKKAAQQLLQRCSQIEPDNDGERFRLIDIRNNLKSIALLLDIKVAKPGASQYEKTAAAILGVENLDLERCSSFEDAEKLKSKLIGLLATEGFTSPWPDSVRAWDMANLISAPEYKHKMAEVSARLRAAAFNKVIRPIVGAEGAGELESASAINYTLVSDVPWAANHEYEGNYQSTIQISSSRRFNQFEAYTFATHEVYPGHHTQAIIREYLHRHNDLGSEGTVSLLNSASSLVSEGLAEASRALLQEEMSINEQIAVLHDQVVNDMRHRLALLINTGKLTKTEAIEQLMAGTGISQARAEQMINFAIHWRYYVPTYALGYYLVKQCMSGQNSPLSLKALYTADSIESLRARLA